MKRFVIDGYNFLFNHEPDPKSIQEMRKSFHRKLSLIYPSFNGEILIVYDGKKKAGEESGYQYFEYFTAYFTNKLETADDFIFDYVSHQKNKKTLKIVTSDKNLKKNCLSVGVSCLTPKQFKGIIQKKEDRKESKAWIEESEQEQKRLENEFLKKLK